MDVSKMTAEDLVAALPESEDNLWEYKSARVLEDKGELKRQLAKQVSAFANSGGGNLVFGLSNSRAIESCIESVGRQPTKDCLSALIEQCVDAPISSYSVHRLPRQNDNSQSIFVVAVEDSLLAPHQAKDERQYYYRIDGHSIPAPHFHLELLRNREVKSILSAEVIDVKAEYVTPYDDREQTKDILRVKVSVRVTNRTLAFAQHWGIELRVQPLAVAMGTPYFRISTNVFSVGEGVLLPRQTRTGTVTFDIESNRKLKRTEYRSYLHTLQLSVVSISHNAVGDVAIADLRSEYWKDFVDWG